MSSDSRSVQIVLLNSNNSFSFYLFSNLFFNPLYLQQDGRLEPAYFSPNNKYFDQLLKTVKNKTTIMNLVFKEFLQT